MGWSQPTWRKSITHRNLSCRPASPFTARHESEVCNAKEAILGSSERLGLASQLSQAYRTRPDVAGSPAASWEGTRCDLRILRIRTLE
jgi:hypothetical protein